MDDTCTIIRDSQGTADDVLNTVTGSLVPPAPDTVTVYDGATLGDAGRELGGRCKVSAADPATDVRRQGGVDIFETAYNGSVPWDAPMPAIGDVLTITSSRRDPELVGQEFRVTAVGVSTFLISRRLRLDKR